MALLRPVEKTFPDSKGKEHTFVLSEFPATVGREIIAGYPLSSLPKIGDYPINEKMMLKLMAHVGVPREGQEPLQLITQTLIDNHVPDWETLARIEMAMMELNCSFFRDGRASKLLQGIAQQAVGWVSETLIPLLEPLSRVEKPPSGNSKQSTPSKTP